ncbi:MAG: hypothetical protein KKD35_02075 [Elusimicrobia bacterium]|nr:hypothetical protein [Elusimicrobiota bacterium]
MSHSEKNKKKALIMFALLFLGLGGGLSIYFMSSGIEDLKDFGKKSKFSYGFDFKEKIVPFFEALGFTDGEDIRKKSETIIVVGDEENNLLTASSFRANAKSSRISTKKEKANSNKSGKSAKHGKLSAKNRGVGADGKSGSKSSLAKVSFSGGTSKEDVDVTQTGFSDKEKAEKAKAYASLQYTNRILAQTHGTNSSLDAKSKWNKSFIGGGADRGKMAYKGPALDLDEMSPSVLDLKDVEEGSLAIPDVGTPKADAAGNAQDPAIKKLAEAANPMEGVMNSMFSGTANSAGTTIGSGDNVPQVSPAAQEYAQGLTMPGEDASVTAFDCSVTPKFCTDNTISGTYYTANYEGTGDYKAGSFIFTEGENGEMVDVLDTFGDGVFYYNR